MFYRVIGEILDGGVSGSGFSIDVNFQFSCFSKKYIDLENSFVHCPHMLD